MITLRDEGGSLYLVRITDKHCYEIMYHISGEKRYFEDGFLTTKFRNTSATRELLAAARSAGKDLQSYQSARLLRSIALTNDLRRRIRKSIDKFNCEKRKK